MDNSACNVSIIGIPVAQSSSTDKMRVGKPEHELENGALHLLAGGGDLGARMRQVDWSQTPLGPVEQWPQSLRTCVRILLTSRQPMFVWWGDDLINLYNDAYRSILGGNGITLHTDVARFQADAEAVYSYEGTHEINALIVGRALTGESAFTR